MISVTLHAARLEVVWGDITTQDVDAAVNAANESLRPGGGVCGAIHRVAGPGLAEACAGMTCPTGEARITSGFDLPARKVIHTVGPVWTGGHAKESDALEACYRNALYLAHRCSLRSIAFPAIGTGVYGYPLAAATMIAIPTVIRTLGQPRFLTAAIPLDLVRFVCFSTEDFEVYKNTLAMCTHLPPLKD